MGLIPHNTLRRWAAPMHQVERRWRLESSRIIVGPEPRVILHVQALRDVEITSLLVRFHGLPDGAMAGESSLMTMAAVHGVRQLKPQGDAGKVVIGRQDLAVPPVAEVLTCQEPGAPVDLFPLHNFCPSFRGFGYWTVTLRLDVPKGLCVGLVARSAIGTGVCEVKIGGR